MKKLFSGLAKFIAVLVAILFVITLVITLFLYSLEKKAFDANTYKEALQNEDFYERLPAAMGDQLAITMGEGESELAHLTKNLSADNWEDFINALVSPDELQNLTEETIDGVFALLNGDSDLARISLGGIKNRLMSGRGVDAILTIMELQPPCTEEDFQAQLNSGEKQGLLLCNPPERVAPMLESFLQKQLESVVANIPNERVLIRKNDLGSDFSDLQSARVMIRLSPLIPVVLLFIMTLLVVRSLRSWLRWWGIPLLTAGGLGLIFSLMAGPILQSRLSLSILKRASQEISGSLLELSHDLFSAIISGFVGGFALFALVIATFGLGLTLGSVFVKKTEE